MFPSQSPFLSSFPPVQQIQHTAKLTTAPQILINLGVIFIEIISYPGMHVLSRTRNFTWPFSAPMFFAQSFLWSMNDTTVCIMSFICLHGLPATITPGTPGYDPSALREYRAWRSVDLPLFSVLSMFSAVAIVVDCTAWMYWSFEKERRARRVTELRDLRMRRMFGRREPYEDMVMGVVQDDEDRQKDGDVLTVRV